MKKKENVDRVIMIILILVMIILHRANIRDIETENKSLKENLKQQKIVIEQKDNDIKRLNLEIEELNGKLKSLEDIVEIKKEEQLKLIEPIKEENLELYYKLYKEIEKNADIYIYYTQNDIDYFYRCVETECHDCSFEAKVNVANVILNRVASDRFKDSVYEVVTSPNQFAYHRTQIAESTKLAVEYAILFEDTTNGALFFHSGKKTDTFSNSEYIFSDDAIHHFY